MDNSLTKGQYHTMEENNSNTPSNKNNYVHAQIQKLTSDAHHVSTIKDAYQKVP